VVYRNIIIIDRFLAESLQNKRETKGVTFSCMIQCSFYRWRCSLSLTYSAQLANRLIEYVYLRQGDLDFTSVCLAVSRITQKPVTKSSRNVMDWQDVIRTPIRLYAGGSLDLYRDPGMFEGILTLRYW